MDLGRVGIWWSGSWRAEGGTPNVGAELEELGYSALWSSGGFEPGLSARFAELLAATSRMAVASGIVSIWVSSPEEVARAASELEERFPGRFLLGLGASHAVLVEQYSRPYSHMISYLDALDTAGPAVAKDRRVLAALGPRMVRLAAERAAGAHPYFVPAEHIAGVREAFGSLALLAPEVTVVLESDAAKARDRARAFTAGYLSLPNYANNLRALGFAEEDLARGGSNRLVDAVVCWGDLDTVRTKVDRYFAAGANHVCVQVLPATQGAFPLAEYRVLAAALIGT